MSISIKNLTKIYGEQKALDNVSVDIDKGQIVGLLGPNGAGKSTMMKIITCFIPPTEGTVRVCDYDIFDNPKQVKESIGYLPEQNPIYYDMYVREFLGFIAGIHKIDRKIRRNRIEEIIELTGISKEANKKIGSLSKGYKQRVGLAQALIHDPQVLILDEPTTGLDPNQLIEIRELIKQVGKTKTVLLSTHIMQEVEAVCSRVLIIDNGKLVADDETKHLAAGQNLETIFRKITNNL
ncbi:MAG TPA: ATP-binding cassette domain-containing protein [Candidatus Onthomorpha intestinigallinarum]|uniref:ATP-binding cassette domain-containing protein n=1 Tax=Candidatus Onthomorpha intestinigallinarum TaxID=2840880 RepID=A0A9D1UGN2_9BACT|nr:ATP-binding cassette domain-containing protein [Candidatus Onthomorpha intestinigallinarum]